jgi:hypothetical protein
MKSIITALFLVAAVAPTSWAAPEAWVVSNYVENIAKQINSTIPDVSFDHLFEAKREKDGWSYVFWNNYGKTWVEEIHIKVTRIETKVTRIEVEAYRTEHGMFFAHKEQKAELVQKTCAWLREIE